MKKLISFLLLIFFIASNCYAERVNNDVISTNTCSDGDILVGTGNNLHNETRTEGTWTAIKNIPKLKGGKGDKGDKGDIGASGEDGVAGNSNSDISPLYPLPHNPFFEIVGEVEFIRNKNWRASAYTKQGTYHEYGLKITVGLGESWTQKELAMINAKMERLEVLLSNAGIKDNVETKIINTESGCSIMIDEQDTVKVINRF